jgi:hypothetical protein
MNKFIVCLCCKDSKNIILPDSIKTNCVSCNDEVWLSKSTRDTRNINEYKIICLNCALEFDGVVEIEMPTKEELIYVKKHIKSDY